MLGVHDVRKGQPPALFAGAVVATALLDDQSNGPLVTSARRVPVGQADGALLWSTG